MSNPSKDPWSALKYLPRYIINTMHAGLYYKKRYHALIMKVYVDENFVGGETLGCLQQHFTHFRGL